MTNKSPFEGGYWGMSSPPKWSLGSWAYEWNANGSLKKVKRPDGSVISFKYDAFGRRIEKKNARATTHFVWDGNVPLHEWKTFDYKETTNNDRITWVFQDFVPVAKLQGNKTYSIISDHLGTPILAIDTNGVKVWERELDIYGKVRKLQGDKWFMPFLYQGQYYDNEVDLCYNRFRYYEPNSGNYISQDPIGLAGNNPNIYAYVTDTNTWVDVFGLDCSKKDFTKINGGTIEDDFINKHSTKHKYDENRISTRNKTQYGKDIDVKKLREDTMNNPDKIEDKLDTEGNLYAKLYKKEYNFNISTNDTETGSHRVFINYLNEESSTQFPFYKPK